MSTTTTHFDLGVILTLTTHHLLGEFSEVHKALERLTGESVWTHQIPRVMREVEPHLRHCFPQFYEEELVQRVKTFCESLGDQAPEIRNASIIVFVGQLSQTYGNDFELPPMPGDDYTSRDPVEELNEMVGPERVIVVSLDEGAG